MLCGLRSRPVTYELQTTWVTAGVGSLCCEGMGRLYNFEFREVCLPIMPVTSPDASQSFDFACVVLRLQRAHVVAGIALLCCEVKGLLTKEIEPGGTGASVLRVTSSVMEVGEVMSWMKEIPPGESMVSQCKALGSCVGELVLATKAPLGAPCTGVPVVVFTPENLKVVAPPITDCDSLALDFDSAELIS